jgi:hypothetical protein
LFLFYDHLLYIIVLLYYVVLYSWKLSITKLKYICAPKYTIKLCTFAERLMKLIRPAGIPGQHSGSIASLASANYYGSATSGPEQHSPAKYPENGHDTLSDFVTFVCQEAESSQGAQVRSRQKLFSYCILQ